MARYRLSQVPLPLLVNSLLVKDEGNSLRIPHLVLDCLHFLPPLLCLEKQYAASPSCPLAPFLQVLMVSQAGGEGGAGTPECWVSESEWEEAKTVHSRSAQIRC